MICVQRLPQVPNTTVFSIGWPPAEVPVIVNAVQNSGLNTAGKSGPVMSKWLYAYLCRVPTSAGRSGKWKLWTVNRPGKPRQLHNWRVARLVPRHCYSRHFRPGLFPRSRSLCSSKRFPASSAGWLTCEARRCLGQGLHYTRTYSQCGHGEGQSLVRRLMMERDHTSGCHSQNILWNRQYRCRQYRRWGSWRPLGLTP